MRNAATTLLALSIALRTAGASGRTSDDTFRRLPASAADAGGPAAPASHSSYALAPLVAHVFGSWGVAVAIGDVTGDTLPDVVVATDWGGLYPSHVVVLPQRPGGALGAALTHSFDVPTSDPGIALADLDEDGVLDVIVGTETGVSVLRADGAGDLLPAIVYEDSRCQALATMDVDRDGHDDVIGATDGGRAIIFHGTGDGTLTCVEHLPTSAGFRSSLAAGDLDGDCFADLAVTPGLGPSPDLSVHHHDGVGDFVGLPDTYALADSIGGIGVGDVTGDGLNDVVLSRKRNSPTVLFVMPQDATGHLGGPLPVPTADSPGPVVVADLDHDGTKDVVVLHHGGAVGVYLNDPASGLEGEVLSRVHSQTRYGVQALAVGDISGDGCPDVVVADGDGVDVLLGGGCFTTPDADGDTVPDTIDKCTTAPDADQGDWDCDDIGDACDNCRFVANADQQDSDADGTGDACEGVPSPISDDDGDGIRNACDNCPAVANSTQEDTDGDGVGNACDDCSTTDADGDTVLDACDNCPLVSNLDQADADRDRSGDACDNCLPVPNPGQRDVDRDGVGDACEDCSLMDSDGDTVGDPCDDCPNNVDPTQADADGDAVGDACDVCPMVADPDQVDRDGDWIGDACDACPDDAGADPDDDGACTDMDNCPRTPNPDQADIDHDGLGDACDSDRDGDGIANNFDCVPDDPAFGPPPLEARDVRLAKRPSTPGTVVVFWVDDRPSAGPNASFDVATGSLDDLRSSRGFVLAACLARALAAASVEDVASGNRWYLVRQRSDCGVGTLGEAGAARDALDDPLLGPCP